MDFSGLEDIFKYMFILLCVSVPLGIWKLVEIVVWLIHHVHVWVS